MELVRSFQAGLIDRRTFISKATKAVGSVAAVGMLVTACQHSKEDNPDPVIDEASTNAPPAEPLAVAGLITTMVEFSGKEDVTESGYLARPEGDGPFPGVIVVQEWWGLNDHIKDLANRFAEEGFVALAPDLYRGVVATEPDAARSLVLELDLDSAIGQIQSSIDYLLSQDFADGDSVGTVGFCMGGRLVLRAATETSSIGATVAFYGTPLTANEVSSVTAPVMGNYGSRDGGIPASSVNAMRDALTAASIDNDIKIYDGAQHAFFNDTRPSYHEEASKDAWTRTLEWFRKYVG
jgi:carboxymethylenebutenolidase